MTNVSFSRCVKCGASIPLNSPWWDVCGEQCSHDRMNMIMGWAQRVGGPKQASPLLEMGPLDELRLTDAEREAVADKPRPGVRYVGVGGHVEQRGGIHSDPLVRLLAYRKWANRDRAWFERAQVPS